MNFQPVVGTKFLNGQQVWLRPMGSGQTPEPAQFVDNDSKEGPRFRFLDGGEVVSDRGEWAPLESPTKDGTPEGIAKDDLREVVKAMGGISRQIGETKMIIAKHILERSQYAGDRGVQAAEAMEQLIRLHKDPEMLAAQREAHRRSEKYDESRAISAVEGAPLTGGALEQAAEKFMEQLTRKVYGDLHMERTVTEIREEHEAAALPEVVAYVRAEFAKEGSKF